MAIDMSSVAKFRDYLDSLEPSEGVQKKFMGEFVTDPFPGPTVTEVMEEVRKSKEKIARELEERRRAEESRVSAMRGGEFDMYGRPTELEKAWKWPAKSAPVIGPAIGSGATVGISPMPAISDVMYNRISPDMFRRLRTTFKLQKYRVEGDGEYRVRMMTNELQKLGSKLMAELMENGAVQVVESRVPLSDEVEVSLTINTALVKDGIVFAMSDKSPVTSESKPAEPKSSKPKTEIDEEGNVSISMAEFKALNKAKLDELLSSLGGNAPSSI
jgi:hypothetical protein